MLEIRHLSHQTEGQDGPGVTLYQGLNLQIAPGEKLVLLGSNGSGKSTLLKLINGLLPLAEGEILWRGQPISPAHLKDRKLARAFRQACVLLFQHPEAMLFNPTVAEEIAYGPRRLEQNRIPERVARWANELGLESLLDKPPFQLSGGEKQKVALASLLAQDPELLLLDEPTASLDPRTTGWLVDTLQESSATAIVSTHNLSLAAELGSRAIVLGSSGQLLFDGPLRLALQDLSLLECAGLAHRHKHRHGGGDRNITHAHLHSHDWDDYQDGP